MNYYFYSTCVGWPRSDVNVRGGLSDMISSNTMVSRRTFLYNVGLELVRELERDLGYDAHHSQGLTMAADWHVSYHRSVLHGQRVYYVLWSGIEHVLARLRVELPPLLPERYELDAGLQIRGNGRRLDPVWLPDTDLDDPEFDQIANLSYKTMDRIRTEEES